MIYIYGDSYACPIHKIDENRDIVAWHKRLEERYLVTNKAVMGSGPDYAYGKYLQDEENFTDADKVIFIHSIPTRINWFGLDPASQNEMKYQKGQIDITKWTTEQTLQFIREHGKEIEYVYNHYNYNHKFDTSVYEKALVLKHIAQSKRIKTYYMVVHIREWQLLQKFHSLMQNDEWFSLYYKPLIKVNTDFNLRNHLSQEQHNSLYSEVLDFIE